MKKEKSCGAIIINDGKVLMVKQGNNVIGFPKGHMEKNETEEETAIRETKEETNIDIILNKDKRFETKYVVHNDIDKTVVYFLAKPTTYDLKKQESEITDIKWVDINNVYDTLMYDNIKQLWQEVLKGIEY